ncbi:MAG: hypothetical protein ABI425_01605 [Patescibacteria group bacterium]
MNRTPVHHTPKVPTGHTRFNFGRHAKKPNQLFLRAVVDGDFFDKNRWRFRSSFFKKYREQIIDSIVLFVTFLFSAWLMFWTFQYHDGQFVMIGRVWSDFAAHIPLIRSFSLGHNFPTEYPTFPGEPIRYHYLFFLIAGVLEKIGFNIATAFNIPSTLGLWLLLWMIYQTTLTLFRSRKAAVLALILFLFNGTWSIWETIKLSSSTLDFFSRIVTAPEYASFGPWDGRIVSAFWNWNIYLNQRHLAASFGIALALCYPLLRITLDKSFRFRSRWYPIIYGGFVLFPLFHQAAYIMALGWCLLWGLVYYKKIPKRVLFLYVWSFLFSFITQFGLTENSKQHAVFALGYLSQDKTILGIAQYWLFNLGLYFILLPIIWVLSPKKVKWFFLPFVGFFILANVFQLSTDMINNHKLINYFTIGGNIITAGFLFVLWKKHWLWQPIILVVILTLTASGIADVFPIMNNHFLYQDDYQRSPIQQWIMKNTPPNTVFLSNEFIFNPASIVGRKLFLDYGYFNWSMGYPDGKRRELLADFYSHSLKKNQLCDLLQKNNISYVHLMNVHGKQEYDVEMSTLFTHFTPIYISEKQEYIFDVGQNCLGM